MSCLTLLTAHAIQWFLFDFWYLLDALFCIFWYLKNGSDGRMIMSLLFMTPAIGCVWCLISYMALLTWVEMNWLSGQRNTMKGSCFAIVGLSYVWVVRWKNFCFGHLIDFLSNKNYCRFTCLIAGHTWSCQVCNCASYQWIDRLQPSLSNNGWCPHYHWAHRSVGRHQG